MERFCGSLLPAIRSRRHPFRSIDRRLLELAQLHQLKAIYGLEDQLNLSPEKGVDISGVRHPGCSYLFHRSKASDNQLIS